MDSLERLMRAAPLPRMLTSGVVATAAARWDLDWEWEWEWEWEREVYQYYIVHI
ncbi:uncharacterized protein Dsimw501_GD28090 [Drosophila simulans]|nr:uncharacterized protein Dsimw501_GD28090 [Drosophila simulans]